MIIAAFNPKGGVGRTATAVNLATVLARTNRRVLLVDLEPEMNASISVGVRPSQSRPSIAEVLLHERRAPDAIRRVDGIDNLYLLTGSTELSQMDARLRHVRQPERRLADTIRPLASEFDMVVMDAPSGYSLISMSVPIAADHLIVPIRADYLALESLAHFLRWYRQRRTSRKAIANVIGILLTMVDHRRQATREIVDIIRVHDQRGVFRTEIPEDPRAAEAPSHGVPVVAYARSRAAKAYVALTEELVARLPRRGHCTPS
jgi:chromosome partitioning protein